MKLFDTQLNNSIWKARYPLHAAVCERNLKEAEALLRYGALVNDVDTYGATPLIYCTRAEDVEMLKVLLRAGADPNKTSSQGILPLWIAADDFDFPVVAKVLRQYGARR